MQRCPAPQPGGRPQVIQRSSLSGPRYRYINSREFACTTTPLLTDSVQTCVAIILHDPTGKKGCLGHIDTDAFGESFENRSPFLYTAIETMATKLGMSKNQLNLYAIGGAGWLDYKALHEALDSKFAKVMVENTLRTNNKQILYDPNGAPPVKIGPYGMTHEERVVSYEEAEDGYEDKGVLYQVTFGDEESYEEVLSQDPP